MKQPDPFEIPPVDFPDEKQLIDKLLRLQKAMASTTGNEPREVQYHVPTEIVKGMAAVATNVWKAKMKMIDPVSGDVRDEMKRVYRHIEGVLESFHEMGMEVKDHTGNAFDYGLPLKVITTQPTQGITRETVSETIRPTVYWKQQIIQMGEVIIATPPTSESK